MLKIPKFNSSKESNKPQPPSVNEIFADGFFNINLDVKLFPFTQFIECKTTTKQTEVFSMNLELINNTLTTMLLDCISHYPERDEKKECFGLIFGEQNENSIGEYTFPVANVVNKTSKSVCADERVNDIVKEARKLVTTSDFIAYYHSHPNDEQFDEWADPSVGDFEVAEEINSTIEVIFAIVKSTNVDQNAPLKYEYSTDMQYNFYKGKNKKVLSSSLIGKDGHIIYGHYKDYDFAVRAYKWTGKELEELKLYSSEVEMNVLLRQNNIILEDLPKESMYYLRKLEYSLRLANKEKYEGKIPYLIEKINSASMKV